jgi:hypothetical protein
MPVSAYPFVSRLQLRLHTGMDENMNPVFRTRSFSNIKTDASNEDIYELAQELGNLQVHPLDAVRRVDEYELDEE